MSITEKLNRIKSCKEDIKQAIIDKGVDMTGVSLEGYATKISEIPQGGGSGDFLEIKENLTTYSNKDITNLNNYMFAFCPNLQTVNLPNLQSMGDSVFENCASLITVNTPNLENMGKRTFVGCTSLTSIDLPNLREAGDSTFENCASLTTVNTPNLTSIPSVMFGQCTSLTSIDLPNVKDIGGDAFNNCSVLESVNLPVCEYMNSQVFCYSGLKSIELPKCLKLEYGVFWACYSLQTVNLPKIQKSGYDGFAYCRSLSSIFTPIIEKIVGGTFQGCESLTELDISKTYWCALKDVSAFNETPFMNGEGKIYVHNSVLSKYQNDTNWAMFSDCFVGVGDAEIPALDILDGMVYGDTSVIYNNFTDYLGLTRDDITYINLPNVEMIYQNEYGEGISFEEFNNLTNVNLTNATYIGDGAFNNCQNLQSAILTNATYIGDRAFQYCNLLTEFAAPYVTYIGANAFSCVRLEYCDQPICKYIGEQAFESCEYLTYINLPKIEYMDNRAFYNCTNLKTITIGNTDSVCSMGGDVFWNCPLETIYVPNNLVEQYKSDGFWSQYADIIVGFDPDIQ